MSALEAIRVLEHLKDQGLEPATQEALQEGIEALKIVDDFRNNQITKLTIKAYDNWRKEHPHG